MSDDESNAGGHVWTPGNRFLFHEWHHCKRCGAARCLSTMGKPDIMIYYADEDQGVLDEPVCDPARRLARRKWCLVGVRGECPYCRAFSMDAGPARPGELLSGTDRRLYRYSCRRCGEENRVAVQDEVS